jgi:hypothetical protein
MVVLPPDAMSSKQRLYTMVSRSSTVYKDRRWKHVTGGDRTFQNTANIEQALREDRQRWMRITYPDIVVDREAWDGPRPDWL